MTEWRQLNKCGAEKVEQQDVQIVKVLTHQGLQCNHVSSRKMLLLLKHRMLRIIFSKRFTVLVVKWQQLGAGGPGGVLQAETGARVQRVVSGPDKGHQ